MNQNTFVEYKSNINQKKEYLIKSKYKNNYNNLKLDLIKKKLSNIENFSQTSSVCEFGNRCDHYVGLLNIRLGNLNFEKQSDILFPEKNSFEYETVFGTDNVSWDFINTSTYGRKWHVVFFPKRYDILAEELYLPTSYALPILINNTWVLKK